MIPYIIGLGSVVLLCVILACIRELCQPCLHQRLRFPMNEQQECLDCLRVRAYKFGEKPGPWEHPDPWQRSKSARVTQ